MMRTYDTIPAEEERTCDCCGRLHRKLYFTDGFWVGKTCREQYERYRFDKNVKSVYWRGYEKQFEKVARMAGGAK